MYAISIVHVCNQYSGKHYIIHKMNKVAQQLLYVVYMVYMLLWEVHHLNKRLNEKNICRLMLASDMELIQF